MTQDFLIHKHFYVSDGLTLSQEGIKLRSLVYIVRKGIPQLLQKLFVNKDGSINSYELLYHYTKNDGTQEKGTALVYIYIYSLRWLLV